MIIIPKKDSKGTHKVKIPITAVGNLGGSTKPKNGLMDIDAPHINVVFSDEIESEILVPIETLVASYRLINEMKKHRAMFSVLPSLEEYYKCESFDSV